MPPARVMVKVRLTVPPSPSTTATSATDTVGGVASSLVMEPMPTLSPITRPPVAFVSRTSSCSVSSGVTSPFTVTVKVAVVSPSAKLTVPLART